MNLQEYQRLKSAVDARRREADRAEGSYNSLLERIKKEFSVNSIEEAKSLLADLTAKEAKAQDAFDSALSKFKKEFPDVLQ